MFINNNNNNKVMMNVINYCLSAAKQTRMQDAHTVHGRCISTPSSSTLVLVSLSR